MNLQAHPTRRGLFPALLDFSFDHFLTPTVARVVYAVNMLAAALIWLGVTAAAFGISHPLGLFTLILLGPSYALLEVVFVRVLLEFFVAVIGMAQDLRQLRTDRQPWHTPVAS